MRAKSAGPARALLGQHQGSPGHGHPVLPMLAIGLLAIAANVLALRNGFVWDGAEMVREAVLRDFDGLVDIWLNPDRIKSEGHYWPITWTTLWVDYQLHGKWAPGWHATNIALHALVSIMVGRTLESAGARGAWIAAAIFAVHPVHAEVAAWTIARKDALAALFALAACHYWFRDERTKRISIWPSALLGAGLLAKSSAVTLVPLIAIAVWWRKGRIERSDLVRLAPLALVASAIVTADVLRYAQIDTYELGHDLPTRIAAAGWALAHQSAALVWPIDLTPMRGPYPGQTANELGWWLLGGVVLVAVMLVWFRDRIGRGPAAALACFVIGLGPTLGLVEFSFLRFSVSADRFQYIASIAPIALAGAGIAIGFKQIGAKWGARARIAGWTALVAPLATLTGMSLQQTVVYRDNITFFTEVHGQIPANPGMTFNLAKALADEGRYEESAAVSEEGSRRHPHDARLANRSGETLRKLGRHREAEAAYRKAISLNPGRAWTYIGLGYTLAARGRREEAIEAFLAAGQRSKRLRGAIAADLAKAQLELGKTQAAIRTYRTGIGLRPHDPVLHANLGAVLVATGRGEEALAHIERAIAIAPNMKLAHELRANVLNERTRAGRTGDGR